MRNHEAALTAPSVATTARSPWLVIWLLEVPGPLGAGEASPQDCPQCALGAHQSSKPLGWGSGFRKVLNLRELERRVCEATLSTPRVATRSPGWEPVSGSVSVIPGAAKSGKTKVPFLKTRCILWVLRSIPLSDQIGHSRPSSRDLELHIRQL